MQVRSINGADRRPGELAKEVKTVNGITIEKGLPPPERRGVNSPYLEVCLSIDVGESFVATTRSMVASKTVKASGRAFTVRQFKPGQYRIWRVK